MVVLQRMVATWDVSREMRVDYCKIFESKCPIALTHHDSFFSLDFLGVLFGVGVALFSVGSDGTDDVPVRESSVLSVTKKGQRAY